MPCVVPSQVVAFINNSSAKHIDIKSKRYHKEQKEAVELGTISSLLSQIPPELISIGQTDYCRLVSSDTAIKNYLERLNNGVLERLEYPAIDGINCAVVILEILKKCPDATPVPSTTELTFIDDELLASSIRLDLSSAASALHNAEWKASTVLAGSVCEALLLWAILRAPGLADLPGKPSHKPVDWKTEQYADVALSLGLITNGTRKIFDQAKKFRHLIHPGRAYRQNETCDRATALTALSAAECIIRDLRVSIHERKIVTENALPEDD
ncbi:hypothetical protein [Acetobacter cerevisiae]|uniref:Uncharacterized protein n=1 Tax=Acetobacter cerevisiae TaxID=178900 RepID=A0A149V6E8_9PROT|nr:hypothetical protein [Acetobacter cerevisiae]KXV75759.1 hypothetical protein AD954_14325 [Acetobacter cerevisiae]